MALAIPLPLTLFKNFNLFSTSSSSSLCTFLPLQTRNLVTKHLIVKAKANTRKESPKIRNRRMQKKFNGTSTKPRLSVFCSEKQLYAMLVDDQNKKCLFYCSTLQASIRETTPQCSTMVSISRIVEDFHLS
ncbi:50S ribosomal protein L18 [Impatiens glandulifera]|uniref:50S ribosomal protein L18 n=1 Tax=Impatiens glandulifera TaxID=253017 RepID=UPI001FB112CD|nr:50S ribosomal protein L18 [Impatiens glandulifera]